MSSKIKPQTLKGFRDFLPAEKRKRDYVTQKIKQTFEAFGFEPLETPTLEYASVLLGKYGKEADKLIYTFKDRGGREMALRYDQTVPVSRVLGQYKDQLPQYWRRYQIQNVFRADKPQKGRYREFTQCDIDIFGSTSPIADAEIIACTYFAFKNIGYPKIILRINDRQTLFSSLKSFSTKTADVLSIIQTIDKLDKKDKLSVLQELIKKGLSSKNANAALAAVAGAALTPNLKQIIEQSKLLGVPNQAIEFTPNLARGLDYYTGMIFEVILPEYPLGSFGGGGRYDNLINKLSGYNIPAVGIAFGFDRMVEAADELNLIPKENTGAKVLVTIFEDPQPALAAAAVLRQKNINAEVFPAQDKIDKQLKYANRKGVNFVLMIGPDEAAKNMVTLKNMQTGKQETITLAQATDVLAR